MRRTPLFLMAAALVLITDLAHAEPPKFALPVACTLDQDCWIVNYVDAEAGPQAKDYMCGSKSYNGHEGTDFGLRTLADVARGVDVLAAADGQVLRMRDGAPDFVKTPGDLQTIRAEKKECGNGIIISHEGGAQSFYCHLKQGSVRVKPGQNIKQGETIAQIGQSGLAEFPHLHFSVIEGGAHIDPFTGRKKEEGCGLTQLNNLWAEDIPYSPLALYDAGFSAEPPDFTAIQNGKNQPDGMLLNPKALIAWGAFYGLDTGDEISLKITDPQGRIVAERTITQDAPKARQYYYTGRKTNENWPEGTYSVQIDAVREGLKPRSLTKTITLAK